MSSSYSDTFVIAMLIEPLLLNRTNRTIESLGLSEVVLRYVGIEPR